jgi:hypothetical protein
MPFALACALLVAMPARSGVHTGAAPTIESMIHDYLMGNPGVLIEALRGAEDKRNRDADNKATEALGNRRSEIFDDPATPVGGNPQGNVAIGEFFGYRCPYLAAFRCSSPIWRTPSPRGWSARVSACWANIAALDCKRASQGERPRYRFPERIAGRR